MRIPWQESYTDLFQVLSYIVIGNKILYACDVGPKLLLQAPYSLSRILKKIKFALKNIGIDLYPIEFNDTSRDKSAYLGMKYSIHLNKTVETTKVEERFPKLRNLIHFAI